ncbi:hypothetical protein [Streptomyces sp. H27-D2]|uniref:hypothetical protein n=1 Tax=Streptomyces sp. H27-D2 TaxID=3046304 RepID=UPI002DC03194|nr:hypothetical protein [Streptomyces sp. H27-D2]MEC4015383.1 hypothetical protein [Streptomyces sp. H27-D2]
MTVKPPPAGAYATYAWSSGMSPAGLDSEAPAAGRDAAEEPELAPAPGEPLDPEHPPAPLPPQPR